MTSRRIRFPLLVVAGVLLMQAAWILTMPPFRGIDEFDHVYRAASVAEGQWRPTTPAADGRGLEVTIPASIVEAASAQCAKLSYTGPDNCQPIRRLPDGRATVATAAGSYNPVYYSVLAPVALVFDGAAVAYGMRALSALMMLLGVGMSALCLSRAGVRMWTRLGLVVALTPVFVYTTALPAPNGLEMVAGLGVWCSLLALFRGPAEPRGTGWVWGLAAVSSSVLAMTRMLGPMWLGLIILTFVALFGWSRTVEVVRVRPLVWTSATAVVVLAGLFNAWWTISAGLLGTSPDVEPGNGGTSLELGTKPVLWALQIVAAFPTRGEPAHPAVYAVYLAVFAAFLAAGFAAADGRARVVLAGMVVVVVLLPVQLTLMTASSQGVIWQGRYGLAFAVGVPLVAGRLMDERWPSGRGRGVAVIAVAMAGVAHVWSVIGVRLLEGRSVASTSDPAWTAPSPWVLATGVAFAAVLMALGVLRPTAETGSDVQEEHDFPLDTGRGECLPGEESADSRGPDGGLPRRQPTRS